MPFYMDRHYVEGATAHAVAVAHTATLAGQDKYRVRFLTYWFDDVRSTAFCLVDSPDKETVRQAHYEWHGLVLHEIIEVDPAVVEAFLGRVADPTPADPLHLENAIDAAFRAIMFTDLKDSTLMTSTLGETPEPCICCMSATSSRAMPCGPTGDGKSSTPATASWPASLLCPTRLRALCRCKRRSSSTTASRRRTR